MLSTFCYLLLPILTLKTIVTKPFSPLDFGLYKNLQPSTRETIKTHWITKSYKPEGKNSNIVYYKHKMQNHNIFFIESINFYYMCL